jgi:hypothetical protein
MRKIINGIAYDTEKAQLIHDWDNGRGSRDFSACNEMLYKTKAGRWFLHGRGGPNSRWAEDEGNNARTGGQDIVPMTEEAAKSWLEEHSPAELYEQHFKAEEA